MRPPTDNETRAEAELATWHLVSSPQPRLQLSAPGVVKRYRSPGYTCVLGPSQGNWELFESTLVPFLPRVFAGGTAAIFAYGHTSSGKTHSLLGYSEPGLYYRAAQALCEVLHGGQMLSVRFGELHNKHMYDLLSDRVECFIREDANGDVHVRAAPVKHDDGRVTVRPSSSVLCTSAKQVAAAIEAGIALRKVGNSMVHAQSSRSHALLEMEVVTPAVLTARDAVVEAEGDIVAAGGRVAEVARLTRILHAKQSELAAVEREAPAGTGGTVVLADLAGAEHGSPERGMTQSAAELREGKEINDSLFALTECIRTLAANKGTKSQRRVPFRSSKLTMLLRRHLLATSCDATMVACIAPAATHAKRSMTTLRYAGQMMVSAS